MRFEQFFHLKSKAYVRNAVDGVDGSRELTRCSAGAVEQ
jgi:hypothetical protein